MNNIKRREGISLVALIITIIVLIILTAAVILTAINTPENNEYAVKMHNKATLQDAVTLYVMTEMLNDIDNFVITSTGATKARDVADVVKDLYENGTWKDGANIKLGVNMTLDELNTVFELDDQAVVSFAEGQEPTLDGTESGNNNQSSSNNNQSSSNNNQSSSNNNQSSGNDNQQGGNDSTTNPINLGWKQGTINSSGVVGGDGAILNNYYSSLIYTDSLTIKLLSDSVMFKIVYYNADGSYKSSSAWQSRGTTQWSTSGINEITIVDSYVRIAIADTTTHSSYDLTMNDYASRYSYEYTTPTFVVNVNENGNDDSNNEGKLTADRTIYLPDVKYGDEGCGFTITGLAYSPSDDTFYAGNYGKMLTSDTQVNNTIVHLSKDFTTNLGEIEVGKIFSGVGDIQGVTVDTTDNTLWFVSTQSSKMYHVTTDGTALGSLSIGGATGIAYDSRTDSLWILVSNTLKNIKKDGTVITSFSIGTIAHHDQLFLDESNNRMYITAGANYSGDNYIYSCDLASKTVSLAYTMADSYAIEGMYIDNNNILYTGNDGLYHQATLRYNVIQCYDLSK